MFGLPGSQWGERSKKNDLEEIADGKTRKKPMWIYEELWKEQIVEEQWSRSCCIKRKSRKELNSRGISVGKGEGVFAK